MQHVARALAKKEFLQLVRRRQLLWLGLAEAVLAFASFSLAGRQWQREAESALVLADTNQRRLANVSDWADLEGVGVLVAPPTPAGRFLVSSKTWPGFLVTVPELPTPLGGLNQEGLPSPAQALLVFYTLFALVLSFDVISGEKSQRTLGLLLAVTTSRRQLLQVKVLVRCAVVALMVIVSQLFAVLVVSFLFPDFVKDPSFFQIFSALLLFLIIASVLFVAVGVTASCIFPEPLGALLAAVGAWVGLIIAVPGVGVVLADAVSPPPNRNLFAAQASALYARYQQRRDDAMVEPLRRWMQEGPPAQPWFEAEANRIRRQLRAELQRELAALFASYLRAEERSAELRFWLVGFSPTGLYEGGLAALASADGTSWRSYLRAVTEYAQGLAETVEKRRGAVRFVMVGQPDPYAHSRPRLEDIPAFVFTPPLATLVGQLPRCLGLVVWAVTFFALAVVSFRRMDPR